MKSLLIKLSLFLPIIISVVVINYKIDPGHLYSNDKLEKEVIEIINSGKNVGGFSDCNERLIQKFWIESQKHSPDVIILGSSRTMSIGKNIFTHSTVVNNSVSGAVLKDFLAIYYLYKRSNLKPQTILFGLDPWLLNGNSEEVRWKSLKNEAFSMMAELNYSVPLSKQSFAIETILNLFSPSYFQDSLSFLIDRKDHHITIFPTEEREAEFSIKLSDGRLSYPENRRKRKQTTIDQLATDYATKGKISQFVNYTELDPNLKTTFKSFVTHLQEQNINLIFYIPPYHPLTYDLLSQRSDAQIINEAEAFFISLSKELHIPIYGGNDPLKNQLNKTDFLDAVHIKEETILKIMPQFSSLLFPENKMDGRIFES